MGLILVNRSKCSGCKALQLEGITYVCQLGVVVKSQLVRDRPHAPRPTAPCYKPKNHRELREAKEKV